MANNVARHTMIVVALTEGESRAIQRALGNALTGNAKDEMGIFMNPAGVGAARRAESKIRWVRHTKPFPPLPVVYAKLITGLIYVLFQTCALLQVRGEKHRLTNHEQSILNAATQAIDRAGAAFRSCEATEESDGS